MLIITIYIDGLCTVVYRYSVRASMTLLFVYSVGTAFLLASTTCNINCLSSSLWVKRLLNSSVSLTPLSAVSLTTLSRCLPCWYNSKSFHWQEGMERNEGNLQLVEQSQLEMENFMKFCRVKISCKYFNETFRENFINFILSKN